MVTMATTTIQIDMSTREKLTHLKMNSRETYDEVLNRLITLIPSGDEEGEYTDAFRIGLLMAKCDVQAGRLVDHSEVKKRLGL
jgi:predicted transcriptional regulator